MTRTRWLFALILALALIFNILFYIQVADRSHGWQATATYGSQQYRQQLTAIATETQP